MTDVDTDTDIDTAACVHEYIQTSDMSDGMIISSGTCSAISAKKQMYAYIYIGMYAYYVRDRFVCEVISSGARQFFLLPTLKKAKTPF